MTLGEYIAAQVQQALEKALENSKGELEDIAKAGGDAASGGLLEDVHNITTTITSIIGAIPIIGGLLEAPLDPLKVAEDGAGKFGLSFGHGYLLGYAAWQLAHPIFQPAIHLINAHTTNEIFDPLTAAQLASKRVISDTFAKSEASGNGLDNPHEGDMIEGEYNYPAITETLDMLNRGIIQPDQATLALQRNGVPDAYVDQILALRHAVLSPADLALAVLRQTMTIDEANVFAEQAGYDADQMNTILLNTGEPPGTMQLLEAYRRGFIDEATLKHGILQSRVRDEWIPVIEKLRYSPMTVADAVRATVENYMTPQQAADIAQQNGLEPDHFPYLLESWGRPLAVGEMLRLMHLGLVTEDQVKQAVRESDIKDKYVDIAIGLGRRLIPDYRIVQMVEHAVITHDQAVVLLKQEGYDDADANNLATLGAASRTTAHKTLTLSETTTMYQDGLLSKSQAEGYLKALGYKPDVIADIIKLADFKRNSSLLKVKMRGIEAELKAKILTREQALSQLTTAGLDHSQAQAYVTEWLESRRTATRTLTEAQILKATTDGVISTDDARTRLQAYGLSDTDIDVLFKLDGFIEYTPLKNVGTFPKGKA